MATELSIPAQGGEPSFPRPTSLYQPQLYTESLLDSSSFSPYPSLNGYRSDPFGLNSYLLHPEDRAWDYLAPAPAEPYGPEGSSKGDDNPPQKGLKRMSSALSLKRGSPLAQTPLMPPAEIPQLVRRRSKSLDSTAERDIRNIVKSTNIENLGTDKEKGKTVGRKGFGRLFGRRKSISGLASLSTDSLPIVPPIISRPDSPIILTPSSSVSDVSTTASKRSSLVKSDSSHSSAASEEIRTPTDSPVIRPTTTIPKLDDFGRLKGTGDSTLRKKSLMSWISVKGKSASRPSVTPSAGSSASASSVSPKSDTSSPSLPKTPIPTINIEPPSRITPSPERLAHAWVGDAIRRASWRKFSQLRRPSPHPLAQHLRRQTTKIPNEVISSFEAGQRIYPKSVNYLSSDGTSLDSHGLLCLLDVKIIFDKLDKGEIPFGTLSKKVINVPEMKKEKTRRSMKNFIERAPFEERYEVFYADGSWSPVSIARPGFGVWDLDFSKYIIALAETGENTEEIKSWPVMPRPSFLTIDELAGSDVDNVIKAENVNMKGSEDVNANEVEKTTKTIEERPLVNERKESSTSLSSTSSCISNSTGTLEDSIITPFEDSTREIPEIKIDLDLSDCTSLTTLVEEPVIASPSRSTSKIAEKMEIVSSFRRSNMATWDDSDYEDNDDEEEEEEEEDTAAEIDQIKARLGSLTTRRPSLPNLRGHHPTSQSVEASSSRPRRNEINVNKIASQSAIDLTRFRSPAADQRQQQSAMEEVARARERRQMLLSGEVDRRVEAEKRKSQILKPSTNRNSTVHPVQDIGQRRRTQSSNSNVTGSGLGSSKKYHSFYEIPSNSSSQLQMKSSLPPTFPHPQQQSPIFYPQPLPQYPFSMPQPQMIYPYASPGLPPSTSRMSIPHVGVPTLNMSISSNIKQQRSSIVQ